jgi:ribonuclease HII
MDGQSLELPRVLRACDFPAGPPTGPGICGIDEAGRGPLAGPVAAAAVVLPADFPFDLLDDSKALSPKRRETAFALIVRLAVDWALGWTSPPEIDELNILEASMLAMRRAYRGLGSRPERVYVDGNRFPRLDRDCWPVIKGDSILPSIMAASIVAKVARDRAMERYDWLYPEYGYSRHKGYPTKMHREACRLYGPSPIQRTSFRYGTRERG